MGQPVEKSNINSRKRARTDQLEVLQDYAGDQKDRFERAVKVLERGKQTREELADALIAFLNRN